MKLVEKCKMKSSISCHQRIKKQNQTKKQKQNQYNNKRCILNFRQIPSILYFFKMDRINMKISLHLIICIIVIGNLIAFSNGEEESTKSTPKSQFPFVEGRVGHGTGHEQVDQPHFAPINYTKFVSNANYSKTKVYSSYGMNPVFNITHGFWDGILVHDPTIPDGYVEVKEDNRLYLGPKAKNNDWAELVSEYWPILLLIFLFLLFIILIPFVGICYCCFCCCRRCGRNCPPCDKKVDGRKRCCYGFFLLLLIVLLLFGFIITFATNRLMDRGFQESTQTLRRGAKDTCEFLLDTAENIKHLFIKNYQELQTTLEEDLRDSHNHIFLDLSDVSKANSLDILLSIVLNMPKAYELMQEVEKLEKDIRFFGSQLRDALRGVKRDVNFIFAHILYTVTMQNFIVSNDLNFLDSGCLHYDRVPNTTIYVEAIKDIMEKNYQEVIKKGVSKLRVISTQIKTQMEFVVPPIIKDVRGGAEVLRQQADIIRNLVDAVVSDIHLKTMRTTESFEDIIMKFGPYRNTINMAICLIILVILISLIIALLCGCCGKRPRAYRDDCCNKAAGGTCLLLAIILIFLTFSLIAIVALFYFIFGLVSYHGACVPLRDQEKNEFFNRVDKYIDLNQLLPKSLMPRDNTNPLPPLRLSNAIKECQANETIYDVLHINNLYNIKELRLLNILQNINKATNLNPGGFNEDLTHLSILDPDDVKLLNDMRLGNLSNYHSTVITQEICREFVHVSLKSLAQGLEDIAFTTSNPEYASALLKNQAIHLRSYHEHLVEPLNAKIAKLYKTTEQIDKLILYKNFNFSDTVATLLQQVKQSEEFIRKRGNDFISEITKNLTTFVKDELERYVDNVIYEAEHNVGKCAPLAYIYDHSIDLVCKRISDPINGYWFGLWLCLLAFLPILFVAHKLQCLYRKVNPYEQPPVIVGGEYLYDAYSEREHLPMANVPKKRRKGGYDRRREHHDYYEEPSPGASHSGMRESRYNDMAPKHWDSEPPRYHNPPMAPPASEYERPPPYYYPGAAEQD